LSSRRIPWLRILVEGAVIVASVLLALAADAWWDGRQERQEETSVLVGLQSDFRATLEVIERSRTASEETAAAAEQLLALTGPGAPEVSAAAMDTLLANALAGSSFDPVAATLDALMSSGDLNLIRSAELRRALAEWAPRVERIRRQRERGDDAALDRFMPYLHEHVPIRALDAISQPVAGSRSSGFQHDARPLLSELRFENGVNDILFYHSWYAARLGELEDFVAQTLDLLATELGSS
jgi:hypothetical protein